jgi:predicted nucleic acid-binding protein
MIFVDSSFWIALANARDGLHGDAMALVERHADRPLVTTNHVRGESWTFLNGRPGHRVAVGLLDRLERTPRLKVVFVSDDLEREALGWLRRRDERPYSFVDATSFALMRFLRMREALTFDDGFAAAGFSVLRT